MEFAKVQEQIINMYTTLCEEQKNSRGEKEDNEAHLNDSEKKMKVKTKYKIVEVLRPFNSVLKYIKLKYTVKNVLFGTGLLTFSNRLVVKKAISRCVCIACVRCKLSTDLLQVDCQNLPQLL